MDALSDVLQTIRLSGVIFLRADLKVRYGISLPPPTLNHPLVRPASPEHRLVMFHIVREGSGYAEVEAHDPIKLSEGDLIIVFDDLHHSIVDTPGRETVDGASLVPDFSSAAPPAVRVGDGDATMRLVCGMLQFVKRGYDPVFSSLPPFLHVARDQGPSSPWIQASVTHIIHEAERGRPGSDALLARLTELLFVETLRTYLAQLPASERGWFAGLNDPVVGRAVEAIHQAPAHSWTVGELAKRAATSRSGFAARFGELVGIAPMTYVTRWRIRLASNLLENQNLSIANVAERVGYDSESAFHRAFKREMGSPPAAWRRRRTCP